MSLLDKVRYLISARDSCAQSVDGRLPAQDITTDYTQLSSLSLRVLDEISSATSALDDAQSAFFRR
jgi:hypothetical protein